MFALLPPGSRLGQHRDPFAGSLRDHLGLVTPNSERCRSVVDGQHYHWRDDEAVMNLFARALNRSLGCALIRSSD
jgi:beta-hydroxylase